MKSRSGERPLRRAQGTRNENERVLIYCEGRNTEDIYLKGIRRELRDRPIEIVIGPSDGEPSMLVQDAVKHRDRFARKTDEKFDQVWCVFDVEAPRPHPSLEPAIAAARKAGLRCALSNPCFELWLILHFEHCTVPGLSSADAGKRLAKLLPGYEPRGSKSFAFAQVRGGMASARERARLLHAAHQREHPGCRSNPCSSMPELLDALGL